MIVVPLGRTVSPRPCGDRSRGSARPLSLLSNASPILSRVGMSVLARSIRLGRVAGARGLYHDAGGEEAPTVIRSGTFRHCVPRMAGAHGCPSLTSSIWMHDGQPQDTDRRQAREIHTCLRTTCR